MSSWSPRFLQDVCAAMLEDKAWMDNVTNRKTRLVLGKLSLCYILLANAGLLIWVDPRHLLLGKSATPESDYRQLRVTLPDTRLYERRELRITDIRANNRVMIALGSVYMPEELGLFRITFTPGKEALGEGLERLLRSIAEAEAEIYGK
ncbi:hypothetical protein BO83DRAFT_421269 [Aspergillus eucalypticola CBS 122712]|uniref:PLP-dependent transferase n=1 Tax=Aspergillus eucalypticola (strain CBS 122712 / IBT 29274) TaxID=1448314 RepID=A0A317URB0_ASPEC|nr:uncharacterized protein BO83DRAFT_421269 [Aspergillus eucalypticola CBS 122712]PWY63097.1 hypothetical protein BO83DRAFT_421269 [Aspergillus eucalypticola CBS 122712]